MESVRREPMRAAQRVAGALFAQCVLCAALLLAPSSVSVARAESCANASIRSEQGSAALALPKCRAFELVSPGSIPSITTESKVEEGGGKASPTGDAVAYFSRYPATGSEESNETWLSRRDASGWTVVGLGPQLTPKPTGTGICQVGVGLSEDLNAYVLAAGGDVYSAGLPNPFGECAQPEADLVPGEPRPYANLYRRNLGGDFELLNLVPPGETPANATYQDASSNLSRVAFTENAKLTPSSPSGFNLFLWVDGLVRQVGVLPNGDVVPATLAAGTLNWFLNGGGVKDGLAPVSNAVSDDGESVVFQANGNLYLRKNAGQPPAAIADCRTTTEPDLGCTLQLDRSIGADASGGGVFQFASRDGERVFFTSDHRLTFPASAETGKPDLYEYDVSAQKIQNLTVASGEAANVRGFSGGSDNGSHLYFVARGVLTGSQQNAQGEIAEAGEPNLYLARNGFLVYVATLAPWEGSSGGRDKLNWWGNDSDLLNTAWSPSGEYLLFSSFKSLTGADNAPAEPGLDVCEAQPTCEELFLYDAEAEALSCVSCAPDGGKPVSNTRLVPTRKQLDRFGSGPRYAPRTVIDSGQVFFETVAALAPGDVNEVRDVYEYDSGERSLISSGTAKGGSGFFDASADGRDIFFITPESLVGSDTDGGLPSVYDARIGGGFPEPPPEPEPCEGEGCRGASSAAPAAAAPGTAAWQGSGNLAGPRRSACGAFARRAGRLARAARELRARSRTLARRSGRSGVRSAKRRSRRLASAAQRRARRAQGLARQTRRCRRAARRAAR